MDSGEVSHAAQRRIVLQYVREKNAGGHHSLFVSCGYCTRPCVFSFAIDANSGRPANHKGASAFTSEFVFYKAPTKRTRIYVANNSLQRSPLQIA